VLVAPSVGCCGRRWLCPIWLYDRTLISMTSTPLEHVGCQNRAYTCSPIMLGRGRYVWFGRCWPIGDARGKSRRLPWLADFWCYYLPYYASRGWYFQYVDMHVGIEKNGRIKSYNDSTVSGNRLMFQDVTG